MTIRNMKLLLTGAAVSLGAAAILVAPSLANGPQTISQKNRTYAPGKITLNVGETLRVLNDDIFLHHAFIKDKNMNYDSGSMESGEARDIIFDETGYFKMGCAIHPKMRLDITVE